MRYAVLIGSLLSFLPGAVFAGAWSFGFSASPALSSPKTELSLPSSNYRFCYSLGLAGMCDLSPSLFGKFVVQYSRKDIIVGTRIPDTRNAMDPATGRIDLSRIVYGDASEVYESFSIPLSVNYKIMTANPIDLVVLCGAECGLLFRQKTVLQPTVTGKSEHVESDNGFIASFMLGGGASYSVSNDVTILLLPQYSYSSYPKSDFGHLNFHTVSVECAILYRL